MTLSEPALRPTWPGRLRRRLADAVPPLSSAALGAIAWAAVNALSAALMLVLARDWATTSSIRDVAIVFGLGAALAFWPAAFLARLIVANPAPEMRFAAAFLALAIATIGFTATIYAFEYRSYYAQWHAPFGTVTWAFQFVFTMLAALYQFAVLGLRLFFPIGFVALFAFSLWIARMPR